jgi:TRAP-type mannitol/chloroaromatic compound transport system permease small subunit|tara:strand:- start:1977 stop:2594 length:618 start_codon:yes stop_codon:yes gene_type:complete
MSNENEIDKPMSHITELTESLDVNTFVLHETPLTQMIDRTVMKVCAVFNWIWVILVIVIIANVVLRYVFSHGMIELEELQWHLFAIGWLVGLSSTFILDGHVRVDVIHDKLQYKTKAWLELFGLLVLLFPFIGFVTYYSIPFVELSWSTSETSTSANGLSARWVVKGFLLFSFVLLNLAAASRLIKVIVSLKNGSPINNNNTILY